MVKVYSTHCPQCKVLEMKLTKAGVEYEICDDVDVMNELGFKAAPMLETEDGIFGFADAIKWVDGQK